MATSIDFITPNVVHNLEICSRLVRCAWMIDNEFGLASSLTLKGRALYPAMRGDTLPAKSYVSKPAGRVASEQGTTLRHELR
jgi:hypothetical protein